MSLPYANPAHKPAESSSGPMEGQRGGGVLVRAGQSCRPNGKLFIEGGARDHVARIGELDKQDYSELL